MVAKWNALGAVKSVGRGSVIFVQALFTIIMWLIILSPVLIPLIISSPMLCRKQV